MQPRATQPTYSKLCDRNFAQYDKYLQSYNSYLAYIVQCDVVSSRADRERGRCECGIDINSFGGDVVVTNTVGVDELLVVQEACGSDGADSKVGIPGLGSTPDSVVGCDFSGGSVPRGKWHDSNRKKKERARAKKPSCGSELYDEEQLRISVLFRKNREEQLEIAKLHREKLEREAETSKLFAVAARDKAKLLALRTSQELKIWDSTDVGLRRRVKERVARSEIAIAKYESIRKEQGVDVEGEEEELERKEEWRNGVCGVPEIQSSIGTSSQLDSIGASSSASRRVVSSISSMSGAEILAEVKRLDSLKDQEAIIAEKRKQENISAQLRDRRKKAREEKLDAKAKTKSSISSFLFF